MLIYVAARWGARAFVREVVAPDLAVMGHEVVSTWQRIPDGSGQSAIPEHDELAIGEAFRDEREVASCDALLGITYPEAEGTGHLVEWGIALALGKLMLLAGPVKSVFHKRAAIRRASWDEMREVLAYSFREPGRPPLDLPKLAPEQLHFAHPSSAARLP